MTVTLCVRDAVLLLSTLPQFDGLINAGRAYVRRRPMHVNRRDKMSVRVKCFVVASGLELPYSQRFVVAHTQQILAARMKYETAHPVVVSIQREQTLKSGSVPDFYGLVA